MRTKARYAVLFVAIGAAFTWLYISWQNDNKDEIRLDLEQNEVGLHEVGGQGHSNKISHPDQDNWRRQRSHVQPDTNDGKSGVIHTREHLNAQKTFDHFGLFPMRRRSDRAWNGVGHVNEMEQYRAAYAKLDRSDKHAESAVQLHLQQQCTPRHNITFLKVHKTGSSTLQNIFLRFGQRHKLTFVLPPQGHHLGFPQFFDRHHMLPVENGVYNIFCHHTRFSQVVMEIMPPNSIYISILRDPVSVFESAFTYFKIDYRIGMTGDQNAMFRFLESPAQYYSAVPSTVHMRNNMLYDFGFPTVKFDDVDFIRQGIEMIDKQFSLILIAEYFEESLILLRDALCWRTEDMVVFKMNTRRQSSINALQENVQRKIRDWNNGDVMLYDYFNQTLWRKIEAYGIDKMAKEVKALKSLTEHYYNLCIETDSADRADGVFDVWQPPGVKINAFVLKASAENNPICENLVRPEIVYTAQLRQSQFPNLTFRKYKRNYKKPKI